MNRTPRRWIIALGALLALQSAPAEARRPPELKEARTLGSIGKPVSAVERLLRGLDQEPNHRGLRRAAARAWPAAAAELRRSADEALRGGRPRDQVAALDRAITLAQRLEGHAVTTDLDPLRGERDLAATVGAAAATAAATEALASSQWGVAVAHLEVAVALAPDEETTTRLAETWRTWAGEAQAGGRLEDAAERWLAAAVVPQAGRPADAVAAAALFKEAGDGLLASGACRGAVVLFERAMTADPTLRTALAEAVACGTVWVTPQPITEAVQGMLRPNLRAALDGQLRVALAQEAGRFVKIGPPPRVASSTWTATVTVESVQTRRDVPTLLRRTARADHATDCRAYPLGVPCTLGVTLVWDELRQDHHTTAVATLRLQPAGGGEAWIVRRIRADVSDTLRWAAGPVGAVVDQGAYVVATSVRMGPSRSASPAELERRRGELTAALQVDAMVHLGSQLATGILRVVDPDAPPPASATP